MSKEHSGRCPSFEKSRIVPSRAICSRSPSRGPSQALLPHGHRDRFIILKVSEHRPTRGLGRLLLRGGPLGLSLSSLPAHRPSTSARTSRKAPQLCEIAYRSICTSSASSETLQRRARATSRRPSRAGQPRRRLRAHIASATAQLRPLRRRAILETVAGRQLDVCADRQPRASAEERQLSSRRGTPAWTCGCRRTKRTARRSRTERRKKKGR